MKLLVMVFSLLFVLSADEVKWLESYEEALEQAKIEKKALLVIMTKEHCRWCKKLEEKTLPNEKISTKISQSFVTVLLVRENANFPRKFKAKIFPTTFFVDREGDIVHKMPGYWSIDDYSSIIDDALNKLEKGI